MKVRFMGRLAVVCLAMAACLGPASAQVSAKVAFEELKKLAGTWVGTIGEGKGAGQTKVLYKVTAAGSALVETLFPDTGHEMVTVYHLDGPHLVLTHYCAALNQPTMRLEPGSKPHELSFRFVSGTNMKLADVHMHALKIQLLDPNHVLSDWTSYEDGKPAGTVHFNLHRKS